ncbi:phage portal protein family protein [Plantactinospora sp. WMMB782]|uniref:phage portal protein family protein n=1 Tax=Plantactinospora sp. WMMB782 TaxID=3404121 RepID=UPI003B946C32
MYSTMRRDGRLAAVLNGYTLQLRRAQWQLDGAGCRPEVVQLVADGLGLNVAGRDKPTGAKRHGVSWSEHLRAALGHLTFGHFGFELVAEITDGRARLTTLAERLPQSIAGIHSDPKTGALLGVDQSTIRGPKNSPQIPAGRLAWYCHEREGAAWQGVSLLRPSYAAWLIKREMIRVAAISNRRWGAGVPVAEALAGTNPTPAQMAEAQAMMSAARAGDQAGAAVPPGFTAKIVGLSGSVPDTLGFIEWLNREMASSALMPHLDLGQGGNGGSRALGQAFLDSWTLALESIAENIADTATRQIAARIVEWNFGDDEPVPTVTISGVGSRREVTAESLQLLLSSGALAADPALEAWVRREYRLPERETPTSAVPAPPPAESPPTARTRRAPKTSPDQLALPIGAS